MTGRPRQRRARLRWLNMFANSPTGYPIRQGLSVGGAEVRGTPVVQLYDNIGYRLKIQEPPAVLAYRDVPNLTPRNNS